ncbi:MAG: AmmeMemoRadiSam system radical SAM enzyme [Desulfobacteraceae bacterium]|nr:MAG: AmmeMemoRadiSam system radical SAM enzyme [Desulfobacteraceae bacterium]
MISRRDFLVKIGKAAALLGTAGGIAHGLSWTVGDGYPDEALAADLKEIIGAAPRARFWTSVPLAGMDCLKCHEPEENILKRKHTHKENSVTCLLCAQKCTLLPGESGKCRSRRNVAGELRSLVYGRPISIHVDPIEKKPFYHFLPGAAAYSLATSGCPLRCKFCQNWQISQASPQGYKVRFIPAAEIVASASDRKAPVIAFTYNEPTVFAEYMLDIAQQARKRQIRSVLISCGYMTEPPLREMCETLEAIKIDLKGYSEKFYREVCGAELRPVLRSIKQAAESKVHLEIVNLVVPTLNDSEKSLKDLSDWVVSELGPQVPVHFTRFHPSYQMPNLPPTPVATLERAREIALDKGMHYPYIGNVPGHSGNHTYCPSCRKMVIKRESFFLAEMHLKDGKCGFCGRPIEGVWGGTYV